MVVLARIRDRARFIEEYAKPAAALVARHGGEYIIRTPKVASLEGVVGEGASAVISRWPDRAAAERFWTSSEYAALKAARAPLADCDVLILEDPA